MHWETYSEKFRLVARLNDKDELYITRCLEYAENLFNQELPVIYDLSHFSLLVGFQEIYILKASNSPIRFYRSFKIPKKRAGEFREISEPLPNLKFIQRWILTEILYKKTPSNFSKAYRPTYSIKDNAKFHRGQKCVLSLDIKDYFGSINFKKVFGFFMKLGYSKAVSTLLTNLCMLNGGLPQGAPTSAMLSNLVTTSIDDALGKYAQQKRIRYTRYADDMTFSGDFEAGKIIRKVNSILDKEGFSLNVLKTRTRYQNQQQEVTGIVVNEKMQAPRSYRRDFRQNIYYIKTYGLESHLRKIGSELPENLYLQSLIGKGQFISNINVHDRMIKNDLLFLKELYKTIKQNEPRPF